MQNLRSRLGLGGLVLVSGMSLSFSFFFSFSFSFSLWFGFGFGFGWCDGSRAEVVVETVVVEW